MFICSFSLHAWTVIFCNIIALLIKFVLCVRHHTWYSAFAYGLRIVGSSSDLDTMRLSLDCFKSSDFLYIFRFGHLKFVFGIDNSALIFRFRNPNTMRSSLYFTFRKMHYVRSAYRWSTFYALFCPRFHKYPQCVTHFGIMVNWHRRHSECALIFRLYSIAPFSYSCGVGETLTIIVVVLVVIL